MSTKPTQTGRNSKQDWFECDANLSSKPEVITEAESKIPVLKPGVN